MSYKMTINQPNLGEGADVYIAGLGIFENGKTYKVSDERARMFQTLNTRVVSEGTQTVLVPGTPLDEVNIYGVTVEKLDEATKAGEQE